MNAGIVVATLLSILWFKEREHWQCRWAVPWWSRWVLAVLSM